MAYHEIGTQDGDQAEKQENEDIAEAPVSIRIAAEGVFHRPADGRETQQDQAKPVHAENPAETDLDHGQTEDDAQHDEQADEPFHVLNGHPAAVQPVLRTLAVRRVRAMQHVAQLVAEVGQNLEADGRQHQEQDGQSFDLVIRHGQQGAQQDPGQRKRQGTEPHGLDGRNEFTHCFFFWGTRL